MITPLQTNGKRGNAGDRTCFKVPTGCAAAASLQVTAATKLEIFWLSTAPPPFKRSTFTASTHCTLVAGCSIICWNQVGTGKVQSDASGTSELLPGANVFQARSALFYPDHHHRRPYTSNSDASSLSAQSPATYTHQYKRYIWFRTAVPIIVSHSHQERECQ